MSDDSINTEKPESTTTDDGFTQAAEYNELASKIGEGDTSAESKNPMTEEELQDLIFQDPEVIAGTEKVLELRRSGKGKAADEAILQNRIYIADLREKLRKEHGLLTQVEMDQLDEETRLKQLAEISLDQATGLSVENQLKYFGLLDGEGKITLDSPFVSNATSRAFEVYIESVRKTEDMSRVANQYGISVKGYVEADRERVKMHDLVASSLATDLHLDFDAARRLAAKARDGKMPNSSESEMYKRAILNLLARQGEDISAGPESAREKIEGIIGNSDPKSADRAETGSIGLDESLSIQLPRTLHNPLKKIFRNDFKQRADSLLETISGSIADKTYHEAINQLKEQYLEGSSDDIELQRLTELILRARQQSLLQDQLNVDRTRLHTENLTHEERVSVGEHYEMLRREACEFNHSLRTLMENSAEHFSREQLTEWIGKASQGRYKWAEGEVTGADSEIAVHAALQGLTELSGVRYGTLAEDLAGYDFVCRWKGSMLTVDAKTGHYPPVEEIKHGHPHIEVSVPREVIQDFRASKRGLEIIRFDIKHALSSIYGAPAHGSHREHSPAAVNITE